MTDRERALRDAIRRSDVHYDARRHAYWQRTEDGGCDLADEDQDTLMNWYLDESLDWEKDADGNFTARWVGVVWEANDE